MRTSKTLDRLEKLITDFDSSLKITKQVDDCTEYLPDDYLIVHGEIASIRVYIEHGDWHLFINASIDINDHHKYDMTPTPRADHGYEFKVDLPEFKSVALTDESGWEEKLIAYMGDAKRFLAAERDLFCRIDVVYYDDDSGSRKLSNGQSCDRYRVHDDDFYTYATVMPTRRTLLPVIADEDKFDPDFLDDDYLRDMKLEDTLTENIIRYGKA